MFSHFAERLDHQVRAIVLKYHLITRDFAKLFDVFRFVESVLDHLDMLSSAPRKTEHCEPLKVRLRLYSIDDLSQLVCTKNVLCKVKLSQRGELQRDLLQNELKDLLRCFHSCKRRKGELLKVLLTVAYDFSTKSCKALEYSLVEPGVCKSVQHHKTECFKH